AGGATLGRPGGERGGVEARGGGRAAGIDPGARDRGVLGERQPRVAQPPLGSRMRRHEIGRARRMIDILVGGLNALEIVTLDQRVTALPFEYGGKLPG